MEYENLYTALQICLERQESISIFFCLATYFKQSGEPQNGLILARFVCQALEHYPTSFKESELGYQVGFAIESMASTIWQLNNIS
jgi:hypothetical protein